MWPRRAATFGAAVLGSGLYLYGEDLRLRASVLLGPNDKDVGHQIDASGVFPRKAWDSNWDQ